MSEDYQLIDDVELIPVADLIPYSNNPKEHPDEQVKKIASSIKNYGWDQPIVVDGDGEIIKGHGRMQAAELLGLDRVPVIRRDDLTGAEARASRIADNKTAESAWDDELLSAELDIILEDFEPIEIGFDDSELDDLLKSFDTDGVPGLDEEPLSEKALEDVKILNLYAGIGGNRKLWGDEPDVTAVEWNEEIADAYRDFYPDDEVVVADAHEYLLEHFDEFDFIWSSPPCPTHSAFRKKFANMGEGDGAPPVYPDMSLYEEILLLQGYFEGRWVVENVNPWYEPLIEPQKSGRHLFWSNFDVPKLEPHGEIGDVLENPDSDRQAEQLGYDPDVLRQYSFPSDYPRDKVINNMVHPEVGKAILESAISQPEQKELAPADD